MTTLYLIDNNDVFTEAVPLVDPYASLPRCTLTPPPETTGTEVAQWIGSSWTVLPAYPPPYKPSVEEQWASVRAERNQRLNACDWTQLPDAPVNAEHWASYRQSLRDITTQSDPFNIAWPEQP